MSLLFVFVFVFVFELLVFLLFSKKKKLLCFIFCFFCFYFFLRQLDVCRSLSSWLLHCRARISELARPLALKVFLPHLLPSSIDPKATLDRSVTAHVESLLESDPLLSAFETEAKRMNPVDESGDTSTSASDYLSSYCDKYRTIVESLAALSTVVLHALKRAEGGSTQSPSFKLVSAQQAAAEAAEKEKAMFGRRNLIDTPHSQRAQTEFMQRQNMVFDSTSFSVKIFLYNKKFNFSCGLFTVASAKSHDNR
jgi:hypothetical protein